MLKADESGHLPFDAATVSEKENYSKLILELIERWRNSSLNKRKEEEEKVVDRTVMSEIKDELMEEIKEMINREKSMRIPTTKSLPVTRL